MSQHSFWQNKKMWTTEGVMIQCITSFQKTLFLDFCMTQTYLLCFSVCWLFFFFLQHSLFPSTFSLFWILKYLKIWKSEIFMFHPLERYSKIWKKFCLVEDLKVNIITCNNLFKKPNVVFCTELDLQYLKTLISVSWYGILSICQGS